jgi:hypothetical protein
VFVSIDQSPAGPSYWWVNQSKTYAAERAEGILWAPKVSANGQRLHHWDPLLEVSLGDRVIHYAGGYIRAISSAATTAVDARRRCCIKHRAFSAPQILHREASGRRQGRGIDWVAQPIR